MKGENERQRPPSVPGYRNPEAGLTDLIHHDRALARPVAGTINEVETSLETDEPGVWEIEQGTDVLCRDGEKVGEVVDVMEGYLVVEQGFFNPSDIYVPLSAIVRHDDSCLYLSYSRDEFEDHDWSQEPVPPSDGDEGADTNG